jgi:hypothetical protein
MANYPIPPWLSHEGADPASAFVSAFNAGANVASDRARLAAASEQAAINAGIREQELNRKAQLEQQKLAVQQAQNTALIGLRDRQLEMQQQKVTNDAIQAARTFALRGAQAQDLAQYRQDSLANQAEGRRQGEERLKIASQKHAESFAAQREYEYRFQEAMEADPTADPAKVARRLALELGPAISGGMTGLGPIMNQGGANGIDFTGLGLEDIPNAPPNLKQFRTGAGSRRIVDLGEGPESTNAPVAIPVQGDPNTIALPKSSKWTYRSKAKVVEPPEIKAARKKLEEYEGFSKPEKLTLQKMDQLRKMIADYEASKNAAAPIATNAPTMTNEPTADASEGNKKVRYNPSTGEFKDIK